MDAPPTRPPRIAAILRGTADEYHVPVRHIIGRQRIPAYVAARQEAMRRCRALIIRGRPMSYAAVGRIFDRDHRTIMWACGASPSTGAQI